MISPELSEERLSCNNPPSRKPSEIPWEILEDLNPNSKINTRIAQISMRLDQLKVWSTFMGPRTFVWVQKIEVHQVRAVTKTSSPVC